MTKKPLRERPQSIKCEDCKKKLEYLCEVNEIMICPKCFTIYDLKKFKETRKDKL